MFGAVAVSAEAKQVFDFGLMSFVHVFKRDRVVDVQDSFVVRRRIDFLPARRAMLTSESAVVCCVKCGALGRDVYGCEEHQLPEAVRA